MSDLINCPDHDVDYPEEDGCFVCDLERKILDLRAENDRLRDALDGVMEGQVYSCIMGEWYWHQRTVPSLESLDKARAALETKP